MLRKILHIIPSVSLQRGGPSFMIRTMTAMQAGAGLEVHVATTDDDGRGRIATPTEGVRREEGVLYRFFPRQTRFYTFSWPMTRWLAAHVSDYDIVHIHALFSYPSIAAAWLASRHTIPYVVRPLGTLSRWGIRRRRPWLKKISLALFEKRILEGAAAVHFTSEQEQAEASDLGFRLTPVVIPNAVTMEDPSEYRGGFRSLYPGDRADKWLLFLSRLDPKKGLDLLFLAMAQLKEEGCRPKLILAGSGDPTFVASLQSQAKELGIIEQLLWTGFLEGDQKKAVLADADAFVLPSYSENFGIAAVEAMSFGLPVVISDQVGIHREVAQAGAGLVVPCQPSPLAGALRRILADPGEMGSSGRELAARRFSKQSVNDQLLALYAGLVRPVTLASGPSSMSTLGGRS